MSTRKFIPTPEWEDARQVRGLVGEHVAMAYLISAGWEIEAHRFRLGHQEVDLIARRGSVVAFVEVKTRRGDTHGSGLEAVSRRKQLAISRVAEIWRLRFGRAGDTYRFDLIAIRDGNPGDQPVVEHVEGAWAIDRR
ncbi:MAG: YraN family protein [Gemmatimonadota bacterium]